MDDDGTGAGVDAAKLSRWCDYLDDGGLDRPIDAIPYELMRCHDDRMADVVGVLLAVAALEGTGGARAIAAAAGGGPGADVDVGGMDGESVSQWVVLVALLSLWAEGVAAPTEPHMTLRKALVTSEGFWRAADAEEPDAGGPSRR
jgi:hypothetical protein